MGSNSVSIIVLILVIVIMYFILIRPQNKKDKELKAMRAKLKVGDRVVTISGVYGRIYKVKEDRVMLEVGPDRVKLEYARWGISQLIKADGTMVTKKKTEETEAPAKKMPKKLTKPAAAPKEDAAPAAEEE